MDIDKDYLAHIFNDDIIYVINDEKGIQSEATDEKVEVEKSAPASVKEMPVTSPKVSDEVAEEKSSYSSPKVLVLISDAPTEKEETLLNNILKAVGLTPDQVDRIYDHPAKFNQLKGTKLMLSFHSNYAPSSAYEINILNGIQVIYAHDLTTLEGNITYKKQLWGNLKQIKL